MLPQLIHSLKGLGMVFHHPALGSFQLLTLQIKALTVNGEMVPFLFSLHYLGALEGGREKGGRGRGEKDGVRENGGGRSEDLFQCTHFNTLTRTCDICCLLNPSPNSHMTVSYHSP